MAYDPSNLFAKIIAGEIPSHKIFETPHAVAILDAFPLVEGHALLLPKHPCVDVTDMPPDVAARIATARSAARRWPLLSHLAVAILAAWAAGGASSAPPCPEAAGAPPARVRFGVGPLTLAWR